MHEKSLPGCSGVGTASYVYLNVEEGLEPTDDSDHREATTTMPIFAFSSFRRDAAIVQMQCANMFVPLHRGVSSLLRACDCSLTIKKM